MSGEMKHTPGPWTTIAGSVFTESDSPCYEIVHGNHLTRSGTEEQRMADARLIAAAPELLKALEGILADVSSYGLAHPEGGRFECDHLDSARAAIAKAKGTL